MKREKRNFNTQGNEKVVKITLDKSFDALLAVQIIYEKTKIALIKEQFTCERIDVCSKWKSS